MCYSFLAQIQRSTWELFKKYIYSLSVAIFMYCNQFQISLSYVVVEDRSERMCVFCDYLIMLRPVITHPPEELSQTAALKQHSSAHVHEHKTMAKSTAVLENKTKLYYVQQK